MKFYILLYFSYAVCEMRIILSLLMRGPEQRSTMGGGGRMTRIGGEKNAQTSSLGKHEGKRVPVRPTSRWKDDIKRSIKKHDATP